MNPNKELISEAKHAATYPDVRPISYRLVERLIEALEQSRKLTIDEVEDHLVRRDCFTERTLNLLDELRGTDGTANGTTDA